ncbi:MAG TPA: ABC transporter substrate-binding protein [Candidatus Binatia bacterium]|nr:ABC transporter substrate-binding protein [Candidatus Binatia bacterium]
MKTQGQLWQKYFILLALATGTTALAALWRTDAAWAQKPKVVKIGILTDAMVPWHTSTNGFRDGLKEFGYVEGKNVIFEARAAEGDLTHLPQLVAELLKHKPDLLFCVADACSKEIGRIPMVFTQVSDPVRLGLVESIARPGGNITGIANLRADLSAKCLELFKEAVPSLRRVLLTYDPRKTEEREALISAKSEARRLKLVLIENSITNPLEIETALAKLNQGGQDGIMIVQSGPNLNIPGRSLQVATSNKIPTMYQASFWTQVGGLASYGPDQYSQGHQAARLAHKILTGTHPRELPVELPHKIEFVINLKTAKVLGLQVPPSVLFRADRVLK